MDDFLKPARMVAVTGATGFIGGAIARTLAGRGWRVRGIVRTPIAVTSEIQPVVVGDLAVPAASGALALAFAGCAAVVHAAGLGHRRGVAAADWRRANVDSALRVAQAALAAGVGRVILISTAHVHGRAPAGEFDETSPIAPSDRYARSKAEAEAAVGALLAGQAGFTALRPAAVIGPRCPGNIPLLARAIQRGLPLPLSGIRNARAFVDVRDLAGLAALLIEAAAPPAALLAAHPDPIATPDLVRALAAGIGRKPRLFALPAPLMALAARAAGRAETWESLGGDYRATPRAALALGWRPARSLEAALEETGRAFRGG